MVREAALVQLSVRLSDTLGEADGPALLQLLVEQCVVLFDVAAAGLVLRHRDGRLEAGAASDERARRVQHLEVQHHQGPGLQCAAEGIEVAALDLAQGEQRWPAFARGALQEGVAAVHALPLRHGSQLLGALELFTVAPGPLDEADRCAAQGLADIATIGLLQYRARASTSLLADQLQTALRSRVVIEQAKGFLAVAGGLELDEAFQRLRARARSRNQLLSEVCKAVVERQLDPRALLD